jgi:hypothetical protein
MLRLVKFTSKGLLLLGLIFQGCTYYKAVQVDPAQLHSENNYPIIQIHTSDNKDYQFNPKDILMTKIDSSQLIIYCKYGKYESIPMDKIEFITIKSIDKKKSIVASGLFGTGVAIVYIAGAILVGVLFMYWLSELFLFFQ